MTKKKTSLSDHKQANQQPIADEVAKPSLIMIVLLLIIVAALLTGGVMRLQNNFTDILGCLLLGLGLGGIVAAWGAIMAYLGKK
ncbi:MULTISPECIES: hypothetical protein [unclassified Acinetobacter]|uniref:hypothetical protein n=1 Tax=unclassified Acinetobacter TaxID=196816 RepID=UPI0035BA0AFE